MSRQTFLERVKQAVMAGRPYRVHAEPVPTEEGYVGISGDLCQSLADEIRFVGGDAVVTANWADARRQVEAWLRLYQARTVVCWRHPVLESLALTSILQELSIDAYDHERLSALPRERQREILLAADAGISSTDWAIAETGTLAVAARPSQERTFSLVPPIHLAVVHRSQIVPDLFDLFAALAQRGLQNLPSHVTLISGPSKTGDIELELTTGVHGPGKWHVVIVRDEAGAARS